MTNWFAPDGLMRLDPEDRGLPFVAGLPETVANQNGILFRAIFELLRARAGTRSNGDEFMSAASLCEDPSEPGRFLRHPGDYTNDEAQDNYAGLLAGCALFEIRSLPRRYFAYGSLNGFYVHHKDEPWNVRYLRQGGEIAFASVCCGYIPSLWLWLWFCAGVLVNAFSGLETGRNHVSDAQLTWVRLEGLEHALARMGRDNGWLKLKAPWLVPSYWVVRLIWRWRTAKKYGHELQPIALYFTHPEHPNKKLALHLMGVGP